MASVRARGVVIKQSDYGEGHRMLSIFTEEYGIIKAVSYGVKKSKGKSASSQFLNYGDFDLYKSSNRDILTINAIDTQDSFYPVSEDIKKLSLCVYFADITYELLGLGNPDDRLLHLFLNSVYALAYRSEDLMKVKTVYELKLMAAGGYAPHIGACMDCGAESTAFDFEKGGTVCAPCRSKNSVPIDKNIYMALGYIIGCDDKKMLMFRADDNLIEKLNAISEQYIRIQTDREFKSLDYFKDICKA